MAIPVTLVVKPGSNLAQEWIEAAEHSENDSWTVVRCDSENTLAQYVKTGFDKAAQDYLLIVLDEKEDFQGWVKSCKEEKRTDWTEGFQLWDPAHSDEFVRDSPTKLTLPSVPKNFARETVNQQDVSLSEMSISSDSLLHSLRAAEAGTKTQLIEVKKWIDSKKGNYYHAILRKYRDEQVKQLRQRLKVLRETDPHFITSSSAHSYQAALDVWKRTLDGLFRIYNPEPIEFSYHIASHQNTGTANRHTLLRSALTDCADTVAISKDYYIKQETEHQKKIGHESNKETDEDTEATTLTADQKDQYLNFVNVCKIIIESSPASTWKVNCEKCISRITLLYIFERIWSGCDRYHLLHSPPNLWDINEETGIAKFGIPDSMATACPLSDFIKPSEYSRYADAIRFFEAESSVVGNFKVEQKKRRGELQIRRMTTNPILEQQTS